MGGEAINADISQSCAPNYGGELARIAGSNANAESAQKRVNITTPVIQLTPEQISERKQRELQEIKRAEEVG